MSDKEFVVVFKRRRASTWVKSAVYWRTLEQAQRVCQQLKKKGYDALVVDDTPNPRSSAVVVDSLP